MKNKILFHNDNKTKNELLENVVIEKTNYKDVFEIIRILKQTFNIENDKKVILDWLLLANTRYFDMCDLKILLDIPYEIRKHRAMLRDNITEEAFQLREKASIDYDADKFDHVIRGDQEIEVGKLVKSL